MDISSATLKGIAREELSGRWWLAVGVSFVAALLGEGGGGISLNLNANSNFGDIFPYLQDMILTIFPIAVLVSIWAVFITFIGPAIELGHKMFYIKLCRGEQVSFSILFSKFSCFWKAFVLRLLTGLLIFLWSLLLLIPGIIAAFRYSMAMYIMADNPEIGILEAIEESKMIMEGNKLDLFVLWLSFIGWAILSILTFGIGFLFLAPYINAVTAAFYLEVSGRH